MTVRKMLKLLRRPDVSPDSEVEVVLSAPNGSLGNLKVNTLSVYHPGNLLPGEPLSARSVVWLETEDVPDWLNPDHPSWGSRR